MSDTAAFVIRYFSFLFLLPSALSILQILFYPPGFQKIFGFREVSTGQGLLSHAGGYLCLVAKPCKSRTFQPLTVHTRPPFPFAFCFLTPVNFGGAAGAVFRTVGFGDEDAAADRTAFQVLIPENLCFQRPVQRQDCPAEPLAAD